MAQPPDAWDSVVHAAVSERTTHLRSLSGKLFLEDNPKSILQEYRQQDQQADAANWARLQDVEALASMHFCLFQCTCTLLLTQVCYVGCSYQTPSCTTAPQSGRPDAWDTVVAAALQSRAAQCHQGGQCGVNPGLSGPSANFEGQHNVTVKPDLC